MLNKRIITIISIIFSLCAFFAHASVESDIEDRVSPIGSLCMAGDACAAAPVVVNTGPRTAEDVYLGKCAACHDSGAAGAPQIANLDAWAPRIAKGVDALYASAINGIGIMSPKGGCADCSDDEIKSTVDYIVSKSQ